METKEMLLIEANQKNPTSFLTKSAESNEKEIWKKAYASYLITLTKSPWVAATERTKLTTLLPIL